MNTQQSFLKNDWRHGFSHGGTLRNKRRGRKQRPLSTKDPLHVVFKINRLKLRANSLRSPGIFSMTTKIIKKYSLLFSVKVEQISIQTDHIHILIRAPRRAKFLSFFRVVSGQMAQIFEKEGLLRSFDVQIGEEPVTDTRKNKAKADKNKIGLWKLRPFTRVVRGWRAYKIVRDYIQLNEKEVCGEIRYQKKRLKGLSNVEWRLLWC